MLIREILESEKDSYNRVVNHPLQSWEWGEFRQQLNTKVIRLDYFENDRLVKAFQLTIHFLPFTHYTIGYLARGPLPDELMLNSLKKIAKQESCLFIKLEPNLVPNKDVHNFLIQNGCRLGKPLFTKFTFQIDLTQSEETLLSQMKEKTRYNVRLAQRAGVTITEDNSKDAFENYLKLSKETTNRQHFFAHNESYHRLMWQILQPAGIAHLLIARSPYHPNSPHPPPLVAWILFLFHDTLYYPYGASSSEHRELMASNLMMWEAMKWGKAHGAKTFDLWGALGPNPSPKDPWYGFHRFKEGYGPKLVEFIGTYDLVINPLLYHFYNLADNLRWFFLKAKTHLPISF